MSEARAAAIAKELGPNVSNVFLDATDEESIAEAVTAAAAIHGRIDGVINCAGTGLGKGVVNKRGEAHDMDSFEFIIRLNLIGTFFRCRKVRCSHVQQRTKRGRRAWRHNQRGFGCRDGWTGTVNLRTLPPRRGVVGMALPMARDLGPRGIRGKHHLSWHF